mgnify:CR=1 FL=1
MRRYADLYKALADETRLAALALILAHGELCVCDVMEVLGVTQSKASRHLRYLKNAGLLEDRREGTWVYYRPNGNPSPETSGLLEANRALIKGMLEPELEKNLKTWLKDKGRCKSCAAVARKAC